MPRCRTVPITEPSVLEQVILAWQSYWNSNPHPPRSWEPFPFRIFQPSFASLFNQACKPPDWLVYPMEQGIQTKPYANYQYTRTKDCMQREVWIRDPQSDKLSRVERSKEIYETCEQKRNPKQTISMNTLPTRDVAAYSLSSPRSPTKQTEKSQSNNLPPVSPRMTSLPKTPSSAVPHTPAPATTIRAKQPSRGTSRELSCKGSMVLIPTATGAYSVPSPLPEIGTKVLVNIAQRECVIRIELDESAVLTSLLANCDPKEELIRLSYERVIVVDQLKSLAPMLINHAKESANPDGTGESDDECEYEVTTRVEHSFHFPAEFYLFQATRVKQNESTVYIQVPRIDSR